MSFFDAEVFARELTAGAKHILEEGDKRPDVDVTTPEVALNQLRLDIEATFAALEVEKDHRRANALRNDLSTFLPARKEAILGVNGFTIGELGNLGKELDFVERVAKVVAKSFILSTKG